MWWFCTFPIDVKCDPIHFCPFLCLFFQHVDWTQHELYFSAVIMFELKVPIKGPRLPVMYTVVPIYHFTGSAIICPTEIKQAEE